MFVIDLRNPGWGIFGWLGGVDIAPSSYEREISFSFGKDARVLEAEVVEEDPEGIGATAYQLEAKTDAFAITRVLLNQEDSVRLRAVVENPEVETYPSWIGRA